ncbi:MAG: ABC transporter transmembrane domain-containing protein, partial [Gammaproteobacteria bacterium]
MSRVKQKDSALDVYKRLLSYARPYWPVFLLAFVAMVGYSLSQPAFAALMKPLTNGGLVGRNPVVIERIAVVMFLLFVARGIASFVLNYSMSWIGRQIIRHLRTKLFAKLLSL